VVVVVEVVVVVVVVLVVVVVVVVVVATVVVVSATLVLSINRHHKHGINKSGKPCHVWMKYDVFVNVVICVVQ